MDKVENNCYGHANGDQEVRMYSHGEAAVLFWDINATATTSWRVTHAVHIENTLTIAN